MISYTPEEIEENRQDAISEADSGLVERFKPGTFGYHEALHTTDIFMNMLEHILNHPAVIRDPKAYRYAHEAHTNLFNLYQYLGCNDDHVEPREMTGFMSTLSKKQQKAALEFIGDDIHGFPQPKVGKSKKKAKKKSKNPIVKYQCPKCHSFRGDDWVQCNGKCPVAMSPHYDKRTFLTYGPLEEKPTK